MSRPDVGLTVRDPCSDSLETSAFWEYLLISEALELHGQSERKKFKIESYNKDYYDIDNNNNYL